MTTDRTDRTARVQDLYDFVIANGEAAPGAPTSPSVEDAIRSFDGSDAATNAVWYAYDALLRALDQLASYGLTESQVSTLRAIAQAGMFGFPRHVECTIGRGKARRQGHKINRANGHDFRSVPALEKLGLIECVTGSAGTVDHLTAEGRDLRAAFV